MLYEKEFIAQIKQKKELSLLDDVFVKQYLEKIFKSNGIPDLSIYTSFEQATRNKKIKKLLSETRKSLRDIYGLFLKNPVSKKMISSIKSIDDPFLISIIEQHRSTEERIPFYSTLYPRLFDDLHKKGLPESFRLLDVACGYNPFAYQFIPSRPKEYVACDLSSEEMACVDTFFKQTDISGFAFGTDALSDTFHEWLTKEKFDVVFFLKALDSFETVRRHSSKKLLSLCNASLIVVSFPLISIGGKAPIQSSKRMWLERFCEFEGWAYSTFKIPSELFYIIKK